MKLSDTCRKIIDMDNNKPSLDLIDPEAEDSFDLINDSPKELKDIEIDEESFEFGANITVRDEKGDTIREAAPAPEDIVTSPLRDYKTSENLASCITRTFVYRPVSKELIPSSPVVLRFVAKQNTILTNF